MKNGPKILLVIAMAFTMSVAAKSLPPRTEVPVGYDIGDTKVVKESLNVVSDCALTANENLFLVYENVATFSETLKLSDPKPTGMVCHEVKNEKAIKIYLVNCQIRQCSGRSVAAA